MRFPSAAKSPVDRLAEPGDEAECGNSPLAITASRCARTKEAAPVITKVKTVNPATARERRNVLKAAKVAITIPRLLGVRLKIDFCRLDHLPKASIYGY